MEELGEGIPITPSQEGATVASGNPDSVDGEIDAVTKVLDTETKTTAENGNEDTAKQESAELTPEQKIRILGENIHNLNKQLDYGLGANIRNSDKSSTILFKRVGLDNTEKHAVFGINSRLGPVKLNESAQKDFVTQGAWEINSSLPNEYIDINAFSTLSNPEAMKGWTEAFTKSRDAALTNRELVTRLKEERNKSLDIAMEVASQPIDLDALVAIPAPSTPTS